MLLTILTQFLFRATFGVALAMAATPPKLVSCGFYRIHLWVIMGANTLVALTLYSQRQAIPFAQRGMLLAIAIGICSYVGGVAWLYESKRLGHGMVTAVTLLGLAASVSCGNLLSGATPHTQWWASVDAVTAGLVLGFTLTAMFLGHWYLNSPGMQLQPLQKLVGLILIAVLLRSVVCGTGLWAELAVPTSDWNAQPYLLGLRWLSGMAGLALITVMTWMTLRIPNTQSATGILYVGVLFAFLGELTSQFLTAGARLPL